MKRKKGERVRKKQTKTTRRGFVNLDDWHFRDVGRWDANEQGSKEKVYRQGVVKVEQEEGKDEVGIVL